MDFTFLFADIAKLEAQLGLPAGFVDHLIEEDDWSFVIKSHSVVEAAIAHLLASLSDGRLATFFQRLPLSGRASKLGAIRAMGALDDNLCAIVERVASLRNDLVHDVSFLSFAFDKHLTTASRYQFAELICRAIAGPKWRDFVDLTEEGLRSMPKPTLAVGVLAVLAHTLFKIDSSAQQEAASKAKDPENIAALFMLLLVLVFSSSRMKNRGETVA